MMIRIYQINIDRDTFRVKHARLSRLKEYSGSAAVDSTIYDQVFEGEVAYRDLEDVYSLFNRSRPEGFSGHVMRTSDVVEVIYSDGSSGFYYCDDSGFIKIPFLPLAQTRPHIHYQPAWGICPESVTPDLFWGVRAVTAYGILTFPSNRQSYRQTKCVTKNERYAFCKWLFRWAIPRLRFHVWFHKTAHISFCSRDRRFRCIAEDRSSRHHLYIGVYMR